MTHDTISPINMIRQNADFVLKNGMVYTVDKDRSRAESIAVHGKKIVYIGSNAGVEDFIGKNTDVIDLDGKMVLPGFTDSHAHVSFGALLATTQLNNLTSMPAYQQSIRDYAGRHPDLETVYGTGWSNTLFPPTGPRKEELDDVVSDRPAAMMSEDGHAVWVNSLALNMAGITRNTPHPEGGVIERDPQSGEPCGTLRETAMDIIFDALPPISVEEMKKGINAYAALAAKEGITTVHDPMLIIPGDSQSYLGSGIMRTNLEAFSQLAGQGQLSLRVRGSLLAVPERGTSQVPAFVTERARHSGSLLQTKAVKIFVDGVIEGSTAYLSEPYVHLPNFRGEPLWEASALNAMCQALDRENFQIHVHAIGDAAAHLTLDAFEYVRNTNGHRDSRHLITHLQLVAPEDIPRLAELGVIGVPQPLWFLKDSFYNTVLSYVGRQRAEHQYPMKSFIEAGVKMASASDFPVTLPCPPLRGIMTGVNRSMPEAAETDNVLWPQERVGLDDMIASFTINGAYANFLENDTGSLEIGKAADLVVFDRNLFEIPASEIDNAKVLLTLFEGKEVYRDHSF